MEDTIAAIATAQGEGGIGIIRISGNESKKILEKVFVPKYLNNNESFSNKQLYYGHIVDSSSNEIIDEVLAVYMKGPSTYTTEDIVEINCHGSNVSLRKTLSLVLRNGAKLAEKGEFTKRAFLNGRIDLSQAEAVIDLIKAKTDKSFEIALSQMEGKLSIKVRELREIIMDILVNVTVNLDYPDEDIEEVTYDELIKSLKLINDELDKLLITADTGRIIKDGLKVTIVGKPNVGKSSLMNALLKESRAIVTEIPGTTRDTIEEFLSINNIPVKLTDTAGIRNTKDKIEKIGIEKSKESFNQADLIIFMIDGSKDLTSEDYEIIEYLKNRKSIVLLNKSDIGTKIEESYIKSIMPRAYIIKTAIKNEIGIKEIENKISELVYGGEVKQQDSMLISNVRHKDLLEKTKKSICDAIDMAERMEALDFIEVDIKRSWELLGEIIGETVTDDIIDRVFERFCLGK
ncbi:tRNA uridine-5-carboxymethylaminomethyl(34) synthesis GTPase MnmE [Anaerovorax odorimutans]|uniref:tRNA uridine-5-carboxymethylaminomethyl(34) synthesis GTPase MnmE n=1 Tax=Anaerovorax odorimutans TaxID=109327 RepID=UPI0012EBE371|nr:tRNA uridine-5-carboxymethylaminomethyl(34) synthesis GTPase MnmE [Anaerovorax odorimutans]